MRNVLLLAALCALAVLMFAPATLAQDTDCADYATQAQAQAVLDADMSDPNGLDADDDGIACETLPGGNMGGGGGSTTTGTTSGTTRGTTTGTTTGTPTGTTTGTTGAAAAQYSTTALPGTGGPSGSALLPIGALLVLGGGILALVAMRRGLTN